MTRSFYRERSGLVTVAAKEPWVLQQNFPFSSSVDELAHRIVPDQWFLFVMGWYFFF
jgi:hypothetical protein